jgi:uncharacterized protein
VDPDRVVTMIVTHKVAAGQEERYEEWLGEVLAAVGGAPGYMGRDVIRPSGKGREWTVVLRFDSYENLEAWANSEERKEHLGRVGDLLEGGDRYEIKTGIDFWFTPETPAVRVPRPYKQFLVTLSVVYPLTLIVPYLFAPLFEVAPALELPVIARFLTAAVVVGLMTYAIMPRYTRLVRRWLYEDPS